MGGTRNSTDFQGLVGYLSNFLGGPRFSYGNKVICGGPRDYIIENPNPRVFSDAEHLALGLMMSGDRIMRLKPRRKKQVRQLL